MRIEVTTGEDELGEPEQMTWDLVPTVNPAETMHLNEHGLPVVGTEVWPGMILVGKIGKTKAYATERKPTALELNSLGFAQLHRQFGHLWYDASQRVPSHVSGKVVSARIEVRSDGRDAAVVEIAEGQ